MGLTPFVLAAALLAAPPPSSGPAHPPKAGAKAQPAARAAAQRPPRKARPPARTEAKKPKQPKVPVPEVCKVPVDKVVAILGQAVTILAAEASRHEGANVDAGALALEKFLSKNREDVRLARRRSLEVQKQVTAPQREACEDYAYRQLYRALTRFMPQAGFYYDRVGVYRLIGDLFR